MAKYRTFYNPDCDMYGVQRYITEYGQKKWVQVLPPRKTQGARHGQSAYTHYEGTAIKWLHELQAQDRLRYLRNELRLERISYGELAELESLREYIAPSDVELLEAIGVPENA